jgi:hypothetical protein
LQRPQNRCFKSFPTGPVGQTTGERANLVDPRRFVDKYFKLKPSLLGVKFQGNALLKRQLSRLEVDKSAPRAILTGHRVARQFPAAEAIHAAADSEKVRDSQSTLLLPG